MKLLILNGPRDPRAAKYPMYRGTWRAHPTYHDAFPRDHEINKLFFWFLEEGGELGLVHDFSKAARYTELLNQNPLPGRGHFEVVEVTDGNASPKEGAQRLGFDVSAGYNYSLLWWRLESTLGTDGPPEPIRELMSLVHRFYAPQLNFHGLFEKAEVASQCLQSMDALQSLSPNLYEGEDLKPNFQAVGLYLHPMPGGRVAS
jgi:hypothetical protein